MGWGGVSHSDEVVLGLSSLKKNVLVRKRREDSIGMGLNLRC